MSNDCPRCDAPLERFQFGESETVSCSSCGYTSINADHSSESGVIKGECPRCEAPLDRLALGDNETVSCSTCGYADVNADHSGESSGSESWDEAIQRFKADH